MKRTSIHAERLLSIRAVCGVMLAAVGAGNALAQDAGVGLCATDPVTVNEIELTLSANGALTVFAIDLDADLDIDIIGGSSNDDTIRWYESDGGSPPSFTEHIVTSTADSVRWVHAADVNGDGPIDIVSASANDDTIRWWENDGGMPPTFAERVVSTTANSARSILAVDVDDDLDTDILVASAFDNTVRWFDNDGALNPTFTERVISTTAASARSVYAADLNGDLHTDLISASANDDKLAWYEADNATPPTFTEHPITLARNAPQAVYADDLDDDNDIDIMLASSFDSTIAWYENDGAGNFTEHILDTEATGASSVHATDVDNDGNIDVLSASATADAIAWYQSDGGIPPTFTKFLIDGSSDGAQGVFGIDIDGDLDSDIAAAAFQADTISWYELGSPILGACCLSDQSCVADLCESDCADQGGWSWTPGATCGEVVCPGTTTPAQFLVNNLSFDNFKQLISDLSDFQTRYWNRQGNNDALDYIEAKFASYGYDNIVRDPFEFMNETQHNIYVTKIGKTRPDEMYILGAHMDTFNINGNFDNAPGADDDGSGCALILELARVLARAETDTSVRLVLWNNEETGLNGSAGYVENHKDLQGTPDEPTWIAMIQHDMIMFDHGPGPIPDADVEYQASEDFGGSAIILANFWAGAMDRYGDIPAEVSGNMRNTDSASFMTEVTAISCRENTRDEIGDGSNPHWHQTTDNFATYTEQDFLHGFNIARMTTGALGECAGARDTGRPKDFRVFFGKYLSGDLTDLWESDDADLVVEQRAAISVLLPVIRIEVDGTSTEASPTELMLTYEASSNALPANVPQRLELFNYTSGLYEIVDQRTATLSDSVVDVTIDTNADRFIEGGTQAMRLRTNYFAPADVFFPAWHGAIDQVLWTITP